MHLYVNAPTITKQFQRKRLVQPRLDRGGGAGRRKGGELMALVLVVDDEEIICNLLAGVFRNAGYRVRTAYGGREAMDLIFQESPDVVLLDVHLPDANGMKLLERICQYDRHLPVILMSAAGTAGMAARAVKAGAFDFLCKPFNLQKLLRVIEKALEFRQAGAVGGASLQSPESMSRLQRRLPQPSTPAGHDFGHGPEPDAR